MNPVNATSLYLSACRSVLRCDPGDPRALTELCNLLPFFRQSLSCLVCGNLLQDPIAPTNSSCQHYVCRECKGQRMQLKPSCSWCKDYSCFQENRQLSVLVHCYRKLCLYIAQSPLASHLSSAATDLPDLQAILSEGVSLAEQEVEPKDLSDSGNQSLSASTSDVQPDEAPPTQESQGEGLSPVALNGTHDCNGLTSSEALQSITIEAEQGVLKSESFEEELPVCVSVTGTGEAGLCDISTFGEDLKHEGGSLLLSVEEVLRTLDTGSDPDPTPLPDSPSSVPLSSLNGPCCPTGPESSRLTPSLPQDDNPCPLQPQSQPSTVVPQPSTVIPQPSTVVSQPSDVVPQPPAVTPVPHVPNRYHRKRSRSESDREKVQPLPIASILQAPPLSANVTPHHPNSSATIKRDPKLASSIPNTHLAPVPNGGPPKVGKTVLVSSKGLKKTLEHHSVPKKVYNKVRQGVPKPRAQPRDRLPAHPHSHPLSHPPSPSKPLYKKPVEKKGCKCGRATQNPSVLTCRGQRCPCYSNRKACLDCICRGCQNSYMANGEKKLEAFAVPEKALEQTRLTLGINLTSITAAALRSPAASSPGNTLINVTTATGTPVTAAFLSGAGHDSRAFDDSLEMRFDC